MRWTGTLGKHAPRRTFVTHGEIEAAESIAQFYRDERGWDVVVPDQLEKAPLF